MKKNKSQKNIPNGWIVKNLDELATISRGGSPRPIEEYITKESDGLNWLRIGDIDLGAKYIYETSQKIKKEGLSRTTLVKNGDFILSNSMSFGRPYIMKIDACIHDGWLALKEIKTNLIGKDFLYHLLSSKKIQNDFISISAGSGVQNLKKETVSCVSVKLPLISEQKRIVAVLEVWDEMVEKLARKIEIKKNIKKGLMQELLSGKKRLAGFKEEWQNVKLEDIARFRRGSFPQPYGLSKWYDDKDGFPFIQVFDVGDNMKLKKMTKRKISKEAQQMSVFVPKESIVLTIQGSIGRIALTSYDAYVDRTLLLFQSFKKPTDKVFFMYSVYLLFQIEKMRADGGTIKTITKETLNQFRIELPELEEQKAIADILVTADREIEKLEEKLRIIKEQKKFLLNNLITGNIRTPENLK